MVNCEGYELWSWCRQLHSGSNNWPLHSWMRINVWCNTICSTIYMRICSGCGGSIWMKLSVEMGIHLGIAYIDAHQHTARLGCISYLLVRLHGWLTDWLADNDRADVHRWMDGPMNEIASPGKRNIQKNAYGIFNCVRLRSLPYHHTHTCAIQHKRKLSSWFIYFNGLPYVYIVFVVGCIAWPKRFAVKKKRVFSRFTTPFMEWYF